jgi:TRAP-type C4-dicarboxylate transport system permease small subunit
VRVAADLCTLGLAAVIAWYGWLLTRGATQITATLKVPQYVVYIVVPVSAVLIVFHTLGDIARHLRTPARGA